MSKKIGRKRFRRWTLHDSYFRLKLKIQIWEDSLREKSKSFKKCSKKNEKLIFLRVITFCVQKFGHTQICNKNSHKTFYSRKPKRQFWENDRSLQLLIEKLLFLYKEATIFVLRKDSRKPIFDIHNSNRICIERTRVKEKFNTFCLVEYKTKLSRNRKTENNLLFNQPG